MPAVQRMDDQNAGGGTITDTVQTFVTVDGKRVAVEGATGSGDGDHDGWQTAHGSATVRIGGAPVIRTGDADSCGHARTGGSSSVRVGG